MLRGKKRTKVTSKNFITKSICQICQKSLIIQAKAMSEIPKSIFESLIIELNCDNESSTDSKEYSCHTKNDAMKSLCDVLNAIT